MRPYLNLVTIGCDLIRELALRHALSILNHRGEVYWAWSNTAVCEHGENPGAASAIAALFASADAVICYGQHDSRIATTVAEWLDRMPETPVLPVGCRAKAILRSARLGNFRASDDQSNSLMSYTARVAASIGMPVSPNPAAVVGALPDIVHALPPATGDLRLLGEVVAGLRSPSPTDVEMALRMLAWRVRPGRVPAPAWTEMNTTASTMAI